LNQRAREFNELQSEWYEKLESDGFKDIEDSSKKDRPLKEWHNFKFINKSKRNSPFYEELDRLSNSKHLLAIANSMAKHGNNLFTALQLKEILGMLKQGETQRQIAKCMNCSQSGIHFILKRFKEWMTLV
jgi:hypothetical protein